MQHEVDTRKLKRAPELAALLAVVAGASPRPVLESYLLCHNRFVSSKSLATALVRELARALKASTPRVNNVLTVLSVWLDLKVHTPELEASERLVQNVRTALSRPLAERDASRVYLSLLRALLARRSRKQCRSLNSPSNGPIADRLWRNTREDIAAMLCRVHWEIFSQIPLEEFISLARGQDRTKTPTLRRFVERCDRLSLWVASCILAQTDLHSQARTYGYMAYIAHACAQAGNFDACGALVAGCTLHEVDRIKRLWKLPEKVELLFRYTRAIVDHGEGWRAYREAVSRRVNSPSMPFVPLVACHLRDLILIEEGNRDRLSDESMNAKKFLQIREVLSVVSIAQHRDEYKAPAMDAARAASLRRHVTELQSRGMSWLEQRSHQVRPFTQTDQSTNNSENSTDPGSHNSSDSDLVDALEGSVAPKFAWTPVAHPEQPRDVP